MKKIIFRILLILCMVTGVYGANISDIENISFKVSESFSSNGEKREQRYDVVISLPDLMKKTVTFPEMNKGEIYLYTKGEKIVYLPFFKQIQKGKATSEENRIIDFIKDLVSRDKNDGKFRTEYNSGNSMKIQLNTGETVEILKKEKVQEFLLPEKIRILSQGKTVAELTMSEYKVNQKLGEEEFKLLNEANK